MGLPIINIIDHVLAAVNSAIKNGKGEILVLLQKKQINGVKVNITISLEVNTVKKETKKYKAKNKVNWLFLALETANEARYLNRPTSSKKMESIVIEKNKTNIFSGLIAALLVQEFLISPIGHNCAMTKISAPIIATIQYVSKVIFPNLILGKNRVDNVIPRNVITLMTIVAIIQVSIIDLLHSNAIDKNEK